MKKEKNNTQIKIMFVCMGNICRSPVAHAVFQKYVDERGLSDQFHIESSGTIDYHVGEQADARMRATAAEHGVHIDHLANHLSAKDLDVYDLVLAMDLDNLKNIRALAKDDSQLQKVKLFRDYDPEAGERAEVPDPYYGGSDGFETVYEIVERASKTLLNKLGDKLETN